MTGRATHDMTLLSRHVVLVSGATAEEGRTKVQRFFKKTSLVRYDRIEFSGDTLSAADDGFSTMLDKALRENRRLLHGFIEELAASGCASRADLAGVAQGYQSKILHIVAHFLDGFIGIDSAFYNLIDDSHWLPDETANAITATPNGYWLFSLSGYSAAPKEAALLHT